MASTLAVDVAVLPSPGIGHIIPFLELSKRLAVDHGLQVSFLVINTLQPSPAQDILLRPEAGATLPPNIRIVDLPPVDVSTIPEDTTLAVQISLLVKRALESLRAVLENPTNRPKVLVIDIFSSEAFDIAEELSIPVYSFFTTSAALLTFSMYLPTLDQEVEGEFIDMPSIQVPGCKSYHPDDLMEPVRNRTIEEYRTILLHMSRLTRASGILLNTWEGFEPVSLSVLQENPVLLQSPVPRVHAIGPLIKQPGKTEMLKSSDIEILTWLDQQPAKSVLFMSFGSGGTLTMEQITELAWGLELSRQRFIWVVRTPTDATGSGTYFNAGSLKSDPVDYLPEGFVERTRELGLVVRSWARQMEILSHPSTAAFLSHCGWNSAVESISCGVPMIAWPLYAEQRMNAAMLAEDAKVAVRVKAVDAMDKETSGAGHVVQRDEVQRVVTMVMATEDGTDGKALRERARELKDEAEKAKSRHGSSEKALAALCREWKTMS